MTTPRVTMAGTPLRPVRLLGAGSLAVVLAAASPVAQTAPSQPASAQPPRADRTDAASVTAVVVDLVVRDRRGNPVVDLNADDFEVREDGVVHPVGSFRAPGREPGGVYAAGTRAPDAAAAGPAGAPASLPRAAAEPAVVALVFDRLSSDSRRLTNLAAERYLGDDVQTSNILGVFATDWGLEVVQGFTRDAGVLRAALARVGSRAPSQGAESRAESRSAMNRANEVQTQIFAGNTGTGAAGAAAGVDLQIAQMQQRMSETYDMLERDQQGFGTINSLTAVVNALKLVPGRKSVMFFSEGLVLPPNVMPRFNSLVDEANRANVAVYAMDAKGLRAESTQMEAAGEIMAYAQDRLSGDGGQIGAGGSAVRYLERNEDRLRMDPSAGLGQLAQETGGFLIQGSNDFDKGFRRVDEDIRSHYILTYSSTKPEYDGRFRSIDVTVKRPGLSVSHRKGYYAVPPTGGGAPILTYEAPALVALESTPVPNAFPVFARAFTFPQAVEATRVPVIVGLRTQSLAYRTDDATKSFQAEFVVVARVRDVNGQVVTKVSQQYTLGGTLDEMEASKRGDVLFYRQPDLPPGLYTLEVVVHDTIADKSSVRISSLEVPEVTKAQPRLSSLFVVQRVEKVPAGDRDDENPLYYGDVLAYPNLGQPVSKSADPELAFAFTVYPEGKPLGGAQLELLKGGQPIGAAPLTLEAPDAQGRVQQISRLPMEAFEPGSYELRVMVQAGDAVLTRSTRFTIGG
jgi:VWFA-related protein